MDEPMTTRAARVTAETETDHAVLELIRAVARQDRHAFKTLYERYAPRIGSYLLKRLKRPELVDEALNDVMLAVWQNADRFDPTQGRLLTWLFGIAHHKGLKALRHAGRSRAEVSFNALSPPGNGVEEPKEALLAVEPHNPERTVMGWELGRALTWALDRLSPEHRAVIGVVSPNPIKFRQLKSSPATILSRSMICPTLRNV